jgi:hypothetical protein
VTLWVEDKVWVRIKRDAQAGNPQAPGARHHLAQQHMVPSVNAVERPNGCDDG